MDEEAQFQCVQKGVGGEEAVTRQARREGREMAQETEMNWTKRRVSILNGKIGFVYASRDDSMGVWRMWTGREELVGRWR